MLDEAWPQPFAVEDHVMRHALRDREPYGIGRQDERSMLRICKKHRGQERVVMDILDDARVIVATTHDTLNTLQDFVSSAFRQWRRRGGDVVHEEGDAGSLHGLRHFHPHFCCVYC